MASETIARSYGAALFTLADRDDALEEYGAAIDELAALMRNEPRLRTFLETPKVDTAEKKRVLREALEPKVPRPFLNFVMVVLDKHRQRLLSMIEEEYRRLVDERLNRLDVEVTLAREPDERMEEDIRSELSEKLGRIVVPRFRVNPELIGGAIVRYGDRVIDGSVRRRLLKLRRRLYHAAMPDTETV